MLNKNKAFTVVEVGIILAIIGLLVAMAIPIYTGLTQPSNSHLTQQKNKSTLTTTGEFIGELPDGRSVRRYEIENDRQHNHFIYVVSDESSRTINYSVSSGKTTRNETVVVINGKEYVEKSN